MKYIDDGDTKWTYLPELPEDVGDYIVTLWHESEPDYFESMACRFDGYVFKYLGITQTMAIAWTELPEPVREVRAAK